MGILPTSFQWMMVQYIIIKTGLKNINWEYTSLIIDSTISWILLETWKTKAVRNVHNQSHLQNWNYAKVTLVWNFDLRTFSVYSCGGQFSKTNKLYIYIQVEMTTIYRCDYVPGRSPHVLLPSITSGLSSTSCLLLTTYTETTTESLKKNHQTT